MWKMLVAFVVFAAVVMFVLLKSGADVDMSGEKHGIDAGHEAASAPAQDAASAVVPAPAASDAASAPASAASM